MNRLPRVFRALTLAIAVSALLGACESVQFQSPPSWPLSDCDTDLVGDWRAKDLQDTEHSDGEQYVRISSDCEHWHTISLENDENGQLKPDIDDIEDDMALSIARTDHQSYIVALDHPDKADEQNPDTKPKGYALIAYEFAENALILRQIDLKTTAHLIIDGAIPGWVDKHDRNPDGSRRAYGADFSVFVFGTSEETKATLEQHELRSPPWMLLTRVDAETSKRIDEWMAAPPE